MTGARDEQYSVGAVGCRAAEEAGLGLLRQQYDAAAQLRNPFQLVLAVACLGLGAYLVWAVGGQLPDLGSHSGESDFVFSLFMYGLLGLMGLGMLLLAGLLVKGFFWPAQWWFGHFDDGVVITRQGKAPLIFPWEQVARVSYLPTKVTLNGAQAGTHHDLSFFFVDGGRPHRMKKLQAQVWGTIGPGVVMDFGRVAAQRMLDEISAGGVRQWRGLELSAAGIRSKNASRPWAEIGPPQLVQPPRGAATIEIPAERGGLPIWRVPMGLGLDSTVIAGSELVATLAQR